MKTERLKKPLSIILGLLLSILSLGSHESSASEQFFENSSGSPLVALLREARTSIDIEIYEMNDPSVDFELRAALSRGVKLNIIQEGTPVGAACHVFGGSSAPSSQTPDCLRQQDLVNHVNSHGGHFIPFSKALCGQPGSRCYQHGKIAIVDGTTLLMSTGNFNTTSLCDRAEHPTRCDRDYTFTSQDSSVISALQTVFNSDLLGKNPDLTHVESTRLTVSPDSMQPILEFIGSAKKTLQIETQYLQDPTLNQAILDAAGRGVKVSVMVSSACSFGKPTPSFIAKWNNTYRSFERGGIQTWIFNEKMKVGGVSGYLHAKAILVDGIRAWMGSVNGSTTSITDNREYGIFFEDSALISELNGYLSSDFNHPQRLSWRDSIACL